MKKWLGMATALTAFAHAAVGTADCGIDDLGGEPLGGGPGYGRALSSGQVTQGVWVPQSADAEDLITAVEGAGSGDVVYVDPAANIDLGSHRDIEIPAGVTLASDRGIAGSRGARLFTTVHGGTVFRKAGTGVRVTGLRLEGPSQTTSAVSSNTSGIRLGHDLAEVDNCEIQQHLEGELCTSRSGWNVGLAHGSNLLGHGRRCQRRLGWQRRESAVR